MNKVLFPRAGAGLQRLADIPMIERFALGRQSGNFVLGLSLALASLTIGGAYAVVGHGAWALSLVGVLAGFSWIGMSIVNHLIDEWASVKDQI